MILILCKNATNRILVTNSHHPLLGTSELQKESRHLADQKRKSVQTPPPRPPSSTGLEDWVPWPQIGSYSVRSLFFLASTVGDPDPHAVGRPVSGSISPSLKSPRKEVGPGSFSQRYGSGSVPKCHGSPTLFSRTGRLLKKT